MTDTQAPAKNLDEVWGIFDPAQLIGSDPRFYVERANQRLQQLTFKLQREPEYFHAFLCGHRGSGKTTELTRLCQNKDITNRYLTISLTMSSFGDEPIHLTADAVMVEICRALMKEGEKLGLGSDYQKEFEDWGQQIVKTFLHDEGVAVEVGAGAGAWFPFFKAQLKTRREWKSEKRQILEPRIQDLIALLNRVAQELKNKTEKQLLVVVDDLEKGESVAHKEMHSRLFQESYDILVQPRFSIVYTLPVYFRGMPECRIPQDELFAFSAVRLYHREQKFQDKPPCSNYESGYKLMTDFITKRVADPGSIFEEGTLDELIRIGGGLFRETTRAVREAAYLAISRQANRINLDDTQKVYEQIKKEYQPIIRGDAVEVLSGVLESKQGWVPGVEPFLQSRAVVEYENSDLWLDLRYVLKPYVRGLNASKN